MCPSLMKSIHWWFVQAQVCTQMFAVSVSSHKSPSLPFAVSSICQLSVPPSLPCRCNSAAPAKLPAASETAPVSPVSQLSFQGCQPPPPLHASTPQIPLYTQVLAPRQEKYPFYSFVALSLTATRYLLQPLLCLL